MKRNSLTLALTTVALAACQYGAGAGGDKSGLRSAQQPGPPVFAQAICANCHAIRPLDLSPNPQAPTFPDIVNRPGVERASLHLFLSDAHNYPKAMDFDLEPHHVDELTDYMISLKNPRYRRAPY